jgi:hypothetical protein
VKSIILILPLLGIIAQPGFRFSGSVETRGQTFRSDPFGNVYVVLDNNLTKYDASLKTAGDYNNPHLGSIYSVDPSDPLRILVYYKDYNQIIWLDNYLNQIRSPVFLDELGLDQAELVCTSSQGGFWVLDGLTSQIIYYNARLEPVHRSMSLSPLWNGDARPVYMIEKNRQLFLNVPGTGIMVFDRFGNYARTIALEVSSSFQVTDQKIYIFNAGKFKSFDLLYGEQSEVILPRADNIMHAEIQPETLFLYSETGFRIYKIIR